MKKCVILLVVWCSIGNLAWAQKKNQGIGLRLGSPVGITYKKYLPGNHALELGIGGASPQWHHDYYRNSFDDYSKYDNYHYINHSVESALYLQGRYLFHYEIPVEGMEGQLDWYWGLGAVMKVAKVRYRYNMASDPSTKTTMKTDLDLGPEGIIGLEYTFQDIPLSVFGEASLMIELADRPGALSVFGGLGLRYNF